jgi:hypothetical protein
MGDEWSVRFKAVDLHVFQPSISDRGAFNTSPTIFDFHHPKQHRISPSHERPSRL